MEAFLVGGVVRDKLMGVPPKDHDIVVVGATPQSMLDKGFRQVGKDFPIFLDDKGRELSLARRSRKGGVADFGPEVTLKEDLLKRDLTINAMAMTEHVDGESFELFDPACGYDDLLNKVLRMVSESAFAEDPVRVLRVARFAARYPDFRIDLDTMQAMKKLVAAGELDNLVPERVWKEVSRGLMENKPSRMLQVLRECGALKVIIPEVDALYGVPQPAQHHPEIDTGIHVEQVIDYAASQNFPLEVRYAALLHDVGKGLTPPNEWPSHHGHEGRGAIPVANASLRMKVPAELRDIAINVATYHGQFHGVLKFKVTSVVKLLRLCDAFRRPERFQLMLQAALCDARGRHGNGVSFADAEYPQALRFSNALFAAKRVNLGEVAERYGKDGRHEFIPAAIHAARARAIKQFEKQYPINN